MSFFRKTDHKPILELLRKYKGNLLKAPTRELARAFKIANSNLESIIEKAEEEYRKEIMLSEKEDQKPT